MLSVGRLDRGRGRVQNRAMSSSSTSTQDGSASSLVPDRSGRFGEFGGRYVPETLTRALEELEAEYEKARADAAFQAELDELLKNYVGRPSPLYHAARLSQQCGGAQIWLKREDLNHTGAHKINNTLGQALLTIRMGKRRVIAETGAGQHGVATATACARFGLDCVVYMGEEDVRRQAPNVFSMKLLGAEVRPVSSGSRTLRDAINEALRDWMSSVETTHYIIGSVVGPHPFPRIVRDFQAVIGREAREQSLRQIGRLPDHVVASVGGGSNAAGIFYPFVEDSSVRLLGVEAGGRGSRAGEHAAPLSFGQPGILHGSFSYVMQDEDGQTSDVHSISAGLDYPGVGLRNSPQPAMRSGPRGSMKPSISSTASAPPRIPKNRPSEVWRSPICSKEISSRLAAIPAPRCDSGATACCPPSGDSVWSASKASR